MNRADANSYYHYDGLGSTRQLTDSTGSVTVSYTYDSFGSLIASTGTSANAYGFTGEQTRGHLSISWWLDPSRGFALLGHDNIRIREDGSERVSTRIRVTKLKEAAPGVWWPMEAYGESRLSKPGEPYSRTVYRASSVVANDPNFDEAIFTVPFPEGYLIDDQIAGKKYRVGPNGKQLVIADTNEPKQLP